jgi:hypothetical protein
MPAVSLDTSDAIELAELLQLVVGWLATDLEHLAASLLEYIGHAVYGPDALRAHLHRFAFRSAAATASTSSGRPLTAMAAPCGRTRRKTTLT